MPPKPFKPPRPSKSTSTSKKTSKNKPDTTRNYTEQSRSKASTSKYKSRVSISIDSNSDSDPFASAPEDVEIEDAVIDYEQEVEEEDERSEYIPQELLTKLMHECFKEKDTRLRKEANVAVGRYMETFVREALARAAFMRAEVDGGRGDGFLEVEDLEKLAPQLLLDF